MVPLPVVPQCDSSRDAELMIRQWTFISRSKNNSHGMRHVYKHTATIEMHFTHWGRVMHICVGKLTIISPDNGLSPGRRQAIIWANARILLIRPLGTYFNEILIEIYASSLTKMHLKLSSGKWRPFCLSLNVLTLCCYFWHQWTIESHWNEGSDWHGEYGVTGPYYISCKRD